MLHDVTTSNMLQHCGADLDTLRKKLQQYLDHEVERLAKGDAVHATLRARACSARCSAPRCTRSRPGRQEINGRQVLVAMFQETESHALCSCCRSRASPAST